MNATHIFLIVSLLLAAYGTVQLTRNCKMRDRLRFLEDHNRKMTQNVIDLKEEIDSLETLIANPGIRTLFVSERDSELAVVAVRAARMFSKKRIVIKSFPYDSYDEEDRDFALREAQELIEKLNER